MRVIIIDPLVGSEYSINLDRDILNVVYDFALILPAMRKVKSLPNIKLRFLAPSKYQNENKVKKAATYPKLLNMTKYLWETISKETKNTYDLLFD
ncbi:MAG: hypothetical protein WBG58_19105 [Ignavibacteriaceae bacterium]